MVRLLRYPKATGLLGTVSLLCALAADTARRADEKMIVCLLLMALLPLLLITLGLCTCRMIVSAEGITYGDLRRMIFLPWDRVSALGVVYCNSRHPYLYGMADVHPDFIALIHKAPRVGPWGFVCPLSRRLIAAVSAYCPFEVDFSVPSAARSSRERQIVWQHALARLSILLPLGIAAFAASGLLIMRLVGRPVSGGAIMGAAAALLMLAVGLFCLYQARSVMMLCPCYCEQGLSCGGLTLPWREIRYAFIHRFAGMSGLFVFTDTPGPLQSRGAYPVRVLSMPDLPTILTVIKINCPEAKAEYGRL